MKKRKAASVATSQNKNEATTAGSSSEASTSLKKDSTASSSSNVYNRLPPAMLPAARSGGESKEKKRRREHAAANTSDTKIAASAALATSGSVGVIMKELLPTVNVASHAFVTKVKDKTMALNIPLRAEPTPAAAAAATRKRTAAEAKRKLMSNRQRKKAGIFHISGKDASALGYDHFVPLHTLWTQYIESILHDDIKSGQPIETKLVKADFHGAIVNVVRGKCPSLIGQSGIIIQETQNTFKIIRRDNQLISVPKMATYFELSVAGHLVTLFGSQLAYRPADRAQRKFKSKQSIEL